MTNPQFFTLLFLLAPILAHAQLPEASPVPTSHFIQTVELPFSIPRGTELRLVAGYAKQKIMLQKDVAAKAVSSLKQLSELFAVVNIGPDTPIVETQASKEVYAALSDIVPPHQLLITLLDKKEEIAPITLCHPHQRIIVWSGDERNHDCPGSAHAISYQLNEPSWSSIAVVAVDEKLKQRIDRVIEQNSGVIKLSCSIVEKYE